MKTFTKISVALTMGIMAAASGAAQENVRTYRQGGSNWVQEISGTITAGKALKLYSGIGSVEVRGNPTQTNITYTIKKVVRRSSEEAAKREWAAFNVSTGKKGDWAWLNGEWPYGKNNKSRMTVEYRVILPKDTDIVRVNTMGGSVGVFSVNGKVYAETAGGSISADDIKEFLNASTMGGSIDVGNVGGEVNLNTAGGSINIGNVGGRIVANTSGGSVQVVKGGQGIRIETAGGSIDVKECGGDLHASTAGGSIDVGTVGAGARLETMGGSIRLAAAKGAVRAETAGGGIRLAKLTSGVQAETASGPIEAEFVATRENFTASHIATTGGDITVYIPSDLPVTIRAAIELANGHNIVSDFNGLKIVNEGGSFGPREIFAEGNLNGGGPVLKVHTSNGNIFLRKTKPRSGK